MVAAPFDNHCLLIVKYVFAVKQSQLSKKSKIPQKFSPLNVLQEGG